MYTYIHVCVCVCVCVCACVCVNLQDYHACGFKNYFLMQFVTSSNNKMWKLQSNGSACLTCYQEYTTACPMYSPLVEARSYSFTTITVVTLFC